MRGESGSTPLPPAGDQFIHLLEKEQEEAEDHLDPDPGAGYSAIEFWHDIGGVWAHGGGKVPASIAA